MAKQKEDPQFSLTKVPHTQLYFALNARCSTKASRQVSFLCIYFTEMLCPFKSCC